MCGITVVDQEFEIQVGTLHIRGMYHISTLVECVHLHACVHVQALSNRTPRCESPIRLHYIRLYP